MNKDNKKVVIDKVYQLNAIKLAYVGDAYFSLMVREFLVNETNKTNREINKIANKVVCAKNQALILDEIINGLNQTELDISLRARNSHINNKAKNSSYEEYSKATQYEALIGFWYLTSDEDRIEKLVRTYIIKTYEELENM